MKNLLFISILVLGMLKASAQEAPAVQNYYLDTRPDYVEIPFAIQERDVFVQASVNGKKGKFHWDTGAPMLILNTGAFQESELSRKGDLNHEASGATGSISNISRLSLETFNVNGLEGLDTPALGMDLSHLSVPSLGLIGAKVMEGYLTFFDFKDQKISMYKTDIDGNCADHTLLDAYKKVEIKKYGHIPIIEVVINGQKLNLALDSGCSTLMINPEYKEALKGSVDFIEMDTLRGGGKEVKILEAFRVKELSFANQSFENVKCFFETGIQSHNPNLRIDGIIGWDIFWHSLIAYNLDQNLIYIRKN